jgi:TPR repeat protein
MAEEKAADLHARLGQEALKESLYPKPLSDEECTQDVVPISRKPPDYPMAALNKGQMGLVETEFTISPQGYVRDLITVKFNIPVFANATAKAMSQWRYAPRIVNDNAVPAHDVRTLFLFQLEDEFGPTGATNANKIRKALNAAREKAVAGAPVEQFRYALMLNDYNKFKSYLKGINLEQQEANQWYLASAVAGLPNAQFTLGRNMMQGKGCAVDEPGGRKWIDAAAAGGFSPAQRFLAQDLIGNTGQQKYRAAMKWLESSVVFGDYYPSKVMLAWEYATSYLDEYRNGDKALELLQGEPGDYHDRVRILETEAAAYAETGEYALAVKKQQEAIKASKNLDWDIPEMRARLASYEASKPWRGAYFVPVPQAASDTATNL